MYITLQDLFTFCLVITSIITLIFLILEFSIKKK